MNNLEWYKDELAESIAEFGFCEVAKAFRGAGCYLSYKCEDCVRDSLDWFLKEHVSYEKPSLGEHSDTSKANERKTLDAKPVESIGCYKIEKMNGGTAFFTKTDFDNSGTKLMTTDKFLKATFGVKKIIVRGPATIIFWEDGSKTVSVCDKDDKFDIEKGIGMCFMKKALGGSYTNVIDTLARVADADNGYLDNDYISKIYNYLRADMSVMNWLFLVNNMMKGQNTTSDTPKNDDSSNASDDERKNLAEALKIVINSIYGLKSTYGTNTKK